MIACGCWLMSQPAGAQPTERVSVDDAGVQGNGFSNFPSISADGRFVAFYSEASNLVAGDTKIGRASCRERVC